MASLAATASPSVLNLKKRSRHLTGDVAYDYDRARSSIKRSRVEEMDANAAVNANSTTANDMPRYSQRQVEFWEQHKLAEMARIRTEFEQFVMTQNAELERTKAQLAETQTQLAGHHQESERLRSENKLLKRAIAIQNQQKEACEQENQQFRRLAVEAAEHIKRLEQTNYALQVHLQTSTQSSRDRTSQLPDVF